jgi:hypothetical protein
LTGFQTNWNNDEQVRGTIACINIQEMAIPVLIDVVFDLVDKNKQIFS